MTSSDNNPQANFPSPCTQDLDRFDEPAQQKSLTCLLNIYFPTKFASVLLSIAATAQAGLVARKTEQQQAQVSVVFWDDIELSGASYSPDGLVQAACNTLPGDWLDRAESVQISSGFSCIFFVFEGCEGTGTSLSGIVGWLPSPLYNGVESFLCTKST